MPRYILAFGANCRGTFGSPGESIAEALLILQSSGFRVDRLSGMHETAPVSALRQARYMNGAVLVSVPQPPAHVLRTLKALERRAGRVPVRSRGERPLDIDIIDAGGRQIGWKRPVRLVKDTPGRRAQRPHWSGRPRLVVPHPLAHGRAFVLDPVADIAPHWWHSGLGRSLRQLRARVRRPPGTIRRLECAVADIANRQPST